MIDHFQGLCLYQSQSCSGLKGIEKNSRGFNSAPTTLVKAKVGTRMLLTTGECLADTTLILGDQQVGYDLNKLLVEIEGKRFGFVKI